MNAINIEEIPNTIPITDIIKASVVQGRIAVPVNRMTTALYKHIAGYPAFREGDGLSIEKVRALDNLIDRLKIVKGERAYVRDLTGMEKPVLDSLIRRYSDELHKALSSEDAVSSLRPKMSAADTIGVSLDRFG